MAAGCVRCGECCDPVGFDVPAFRARMIRDMGRPLEFDREQARARVHEIRFIWEHWSDNGDGTATCDRFDPATRLCTAHDDRPAVCSNYPWYGDAPHRQWAGVDPMHRGCSFQADLPARDRSPEWTPVLLAVGKDLG